MSATRTQRRTPTADSTAAADRAEALVRSLGETLDRTVRPLLAGVSRVALLDVPTHQNVGDSAIHLGTLALLRRAGVRVCYACSIETYARDTLARQLGDGAILLAGGGNLGDLWPLHQQLRERVLADFPDRAVIQLPQSLYFADPAALARARTAFAAHRRFTLLLRDARSLAAARRAFDAPTDLCPDLAFALGPLRRPVAPTARVVWLARRDREAAPTSDSGAHKTFDWALQPPSPLSRVERMGHALTSAHPSLEPYAHGPLMRLGVIASRRRVRSGCAMLAAGDTVITDRLHGHILSLLLGIPHAVLDNSYGKVRSFYETWTRDAPIVRWAESAAEAVRTVEQWTS
ncbi:MAG: polysaccharide pyruvyl transferase family protein [Gemmatimonadaceae bacterium]